MIAELLKMAQAEALEEEASSEADAEAILEGAIEDAVAAVTEQVPDAAPEEIAEAAAEILPEVVEEKTSAYLMAKEAAEPVMGVYEHLGKQPGKLRALGRFAKANPLLAGGLAAAGAAGGAGAGYLAGRTKEAKERPDHRGWAAHNPTATGVLGGALGQAIGSGISGSVIRRSHEQGLTDKEKEQLRKRLSFAGRHPVMTGVGSTLAGTMLGALLFRKSPSRSLAGAVTGLLAGSGIGGKLTGRSYDKARKQASDADFETEVVKTARDFLATSGFNPDTGERYSKVALAQTREEAVKIAALELLESREWPIQWDPQLLARAAGKEE
jgi:hypothetical protein